MESPESGVALYIKKLLPNWGKVGLSSPSQVLTEGRFPWESGAESEGPLEDFSNLPEKTERFLLSKEEVKTKDQILLLLTEAPIICHSTSYLAGTERSLPPKLPPDSCHNILPRVTLLKQAGKGLWGVPMDKGC